MLKYQTQVPSQIPITIFPPLEVRMEVVFGTPSQNCIGSGVCMVMHHLPQRYPLYCPHAPALISYQGGQLLFRFIKDDMQRADAVARFSGSYFEVNEAFRMPRSTARRIGMPTEWVRPGVYPIEGNVREWQVRFEIKEAAGFRKYSALSALSK